MTLAWEIFFVFTGLLVGYMLGVSDGKFEGRIESFQRDER